ncbi:HAD-IIA family hydrolase [Paenibacillus dakarensis]|uniref:HAD-IIA family hydrolase n=1 Tax=Paenibacillus dakarensis TaxID=1527293 RepID=UPI0006D550FB|nr:HAD-IIA family hydrolase [Paenibacillus dakarensis]
MDHFSGYIFDLDGTIYLGNQAIEGAVETIQYLQSQDKKLLFLTNKTIESRENYLKKLNGFGIKIGLDNILNPALVTIHYLQKNHAGEKVYVIGEEILKNEFRENGIEFATCPEETDVVVVSWDRDFHYNHLDFAYQAIKNGATVVATHPDRTCPMPGGDVPDCGGMIGAIEGTTGMQINLVMGKPSVLTALAALDILQVDAKDCLMSGDRLETDILMGNNAGMSTALVLTGVTQREDLSAMQVKPSYVLNSVYDIYRNSRLQNMKN